MKSSLGSITKLEDGKYLVRVEHGRDPVDGKRRTASRTVYGTERDAELWRTRLLIELGATPTGKHLTVKTYLEDMWLPSVKRRVRARTYDGYKNKCDLYILPYLGRVPLADLEPYQLESWLDRLADKKKSPHTRLHAFRVLRTALRRAVKWKLMTVDPTAAVDHPSVRIPKPQALTVDEAMKVLDGFRGHPAELGVVLALGAGLRLSEVCGLEWADIEWNTGELEVLRGLHQRSGETWLEPPKSENSQRTVALPPWALERLREARGIGRVVTMKPQRLTAAYRAHVADTKLPAVPFRSLRHSHATLLLAAGVDLDTVSKRLGHSTIAITSKHYLAGTRAADRAAAQAFSLWTIVDDGGTQRLEDEGLDLKRDDKQADGEAV